MYYITWRKRNNEAATQQTRDDWTRLHADHKAAHRHDHAWRQTQKMTYDL